MPKPGDILKDRYELVRFVGEGGMGVVWEGTHRTIGKKVAIKFLRAEGPGGAESFERLQKEARIASSVGHSSIVEVFDMDTTADGTPFMVMEFLEGRSLESVLENEKKIPVDQALKVIRRVLQALDLVHKKGVIHRDIKPDNIFLCKDDLGGEVKIRDLADRAGEIKLLDFGLSKITDPGAGEQVTGGTVMGTPYYMSPELLGRGRDLDHRSDIFSMGVILFECVTGRVPFDGETFRDVFHAIRTEKPDVAAAFREAGVPAGLARIVSRAIAKNPSERYQSCAEFAKDLDRALAASKKSTVVVETTEAEPAPSTSRTRPVLYAVAALVLLGGLFAAAWGTGLFEKKVAPPAEPPVEGTVSEAAPPPEATPPPDETAPPAETAPPVETDAVEPAPPVETEVKSRPKPRPKPDDPGSTKGKTLKKAGHSTVIDTTFGD